MKNMKKKFLAVVSSTFALTLMAGGAVAQTEAKAEGFIADTQYLEMQMDGAAVKLPTYDENGVPTGETGIRFTAVAKPAILTLEGVTEVGVMIVPAKVLDAFDAQKDGGTSDYFEFFTSKGVAKESITYSVTPDKLNAEEDTNVRVSIVNLDNYDYNVKYQAVGYYQVGESYYYTQESQTRSVAEVANNALLSDTFTGDRKAVASIVEKAITVAQGETVTVGTYKTKDFAETINAIGIENAEDFEFSMDTNNAFAIEGSTVTAKSTSATTTVNVKAYDGELDYDFSVKAKAERGKTQVMLNNAETFTTYGTTNATMTANSFNGQWNTIDSITLASGTTPAGAALNNMTTTDLSYISFNRLASASSNPNHTGDFCLAIDFTGNNMPMVSYYVEENNGTENIVNKKGVLLTNGFRLNNGEGDDSVFQDRFTAFGFLQLCSNVNDNDNTTQTTENELDRRLYVEAQGAISYNALSKNPNQKYRYFVRVSGQAKKILIDAELYVIESDGTTGALVGEISWSRNYAPIDYTTFYKGNIVIYGRPYEETKIDRIYLPLAANLTSYQKYAPFVKA